MTAPTPDEVAVDLEALDAERKRQAVLDLVDGYVKTADFILGLRIHGLSNDDVTMALADVDSLFIMALRNSA